MPPLPPLPANSTPRLWLDYTSRGVPHSLLLRFDSSTTPAQDLAACSSLIASLRELMLTTDSFTGARFSSEDSEVSFPLAFDAQAGQNANGGSDSDPQAFFYSWSGRDIIGRKANYKFYGTLGVATRPDTNRFPVGAFGLVDNVLSALMALTTAGAGEPELVTIGEAPPIFNQYTNCAQNSYWQRKQRG